MCCSSSQFVLLCCFFVHLHFIAFSKWIINVLIPDATWLLSMLQGVAYLLYPFCGWTAEVYFSNLKMIKWSLILLLMSSLVLVIYITYSIVLNPYVIRTFGASLVMVSLVVGTAGLGMFESNAIQFGMDQMLEASSEQLSSFIHIYFWCIHLGPLAVFCLIMAITFFLQHCAYQVNNAHMSVYETNSKAILHIVLIYSSLQALTSLPLILYAYCTNRQVHGQRSRNSLKLVYEVLKYSWRHKTPEWRSALTYWENDIPSRIDLGKDKYGGPFTYEQVEDVKTFFRLLLLILSLFGFQLSGDGYSLTYYIMNKSGCPSAIPFTTLMITPQNIPLLVVVIGVPVFQCLKKHFPWCIKMLIRLWIGLFISLFTEALQILLSLFVKNENFNCPEMHDI